MTPDDADLRARLAAFARDASAESGKPEQPPSARPARPARPDIAPVDPTPTPIDESLWHPPQAPRLTGVPAADVVLPPPVTLTDGRRHATPAARWTSSHDDRVGRKRLDTALPPCLTLAVTLPILAVLWFTLDRYSLLRSNPLGLTLPIGLFAAGSAFLALSLVLYRRTRCGVLKPDGGPATV